MKLVMKVARAILLSIPLLVILYVALFYCLLVWPADRLHRSFAATNRHGITIVSSSGNCGMDKPLMSQNGSETIEPRFTVYKSMLFYWSEHDLSLAVVPSAGGKPRFYSAKPYVDASDFGVKRITTNGIFATLDREDGAGAPSALLMDLRNRHCKRLPGMAQARLNPSDTSRIIARTEQGRFAIGDVSKNAWEYIGFAYNSPYGWDYDFNKKVIYAISRDARSLIIYDSVTHNRKSVNIPRPWKCYNAFWQPKLNELWVTGNADFSALSASKAPVFSGDGRYMGNLCDVDYPFYAQGLDEP